MWLGEISCDRLCKFMQFVEMAHLTALQFDNKNPAGGRGGYDKARNMLRPYDCFANVFLTRRVVVWKLAGGFLWI